MAVPKVPTLAPATLVAHAQAAPPARHSSMAGSAAIFKHGKKSDPQTDRMVIAKKWQVEAYRQVNICGEARYAANLFAAIASRAEIGISEPQALVRKAVWVKDGAEVEALAELAPDVRSRSKLIRDYMLHRTIAGECYLIARERLATDPGYEEPPDGWMTWKDYLEGTMPDLDPLDPEFDPDDYIMEDPNVANPIWEIVAVTELQKVGETWRVRHDNHNWVDLKSDDPVIRMWNPDPEDRREAWSPFRSLLPTLREIEWLTQHIFTQVRSRLLSAGVWFLPDNLTFPPPPPDSIEGGAEAIALLNEAEQFMLSLAASGMYQLDADEVSFPTVVMSDPLGLANIDQDKLIQFWSDIDDKAMLLRADAVRRFALGMDLPAEQTLGSSGLAVSGSSGSAGSVNHWGEWAKQEQTISSHVEPALDDFVQVLTIAYLRSAVEGTALVVGYDTATLRLRQDRSKEAIELYDRGLLKREVTLREVGFDPDNDLMDEDEHRLWILSKIVSGSATPEQLQAAFLLLTKEELPVKPLPELEPGETAPELPDSTRPSLEQHPVQGPPQGDHDHNDAPFATKFARIAACEGLVLRALEKSGNRLLNDGKRGRDKDRSTPPHMAHLTASIQRTVIAGEFDFSLAPTLLEGMTAAQLASTTRQLGAYCAYLYNSGEAYSRDGLLAAVKGL